MRAAVYLRISDDKGGESTATGRQRADCLKYAGTRGWTVADEFEDSDISAYKRTAKRPEFERLLEAVRQRDVDVVLAWKLDRIGRRMRDFVRLDEACEAVGASIVTISDGVDTRQATGRFVAQLLTAQANMESANISTRVRRKHEERASLGRPNIGGVRPFGYDRRREHVDQAEAALIREAAARILAGESLRSVAFDWRARGVTTPTGRAWGPTPLKKMLASAALSGQREHRGALTPGTWAPILSPEDTRRLRAVFEERKGKRPVTKYLLTGLLVCGRCGGPLRGQPRLDGTRRYTCTRTPTGEGCGKLARLAQPVEDFVRDAIVFVLDSESLRAFVEEASHDDDAPLIEGIRRDEEALAELSRDYYTERAISRAEFFASRDVLQDRLEKARKSLSKRNGKGILNDVVGAGEAVAKQWDERPLHWQRALVEALVDRVTLLPAVKGSTKFNPELIQIVWRF